MFIQCRHLFVLLLCSSLLSPPTTAYYYGDTSLLEYLNTLCNTSNLNSILLLVDNLLLVNKSPTRPQQTPLRRQLERLHCPFTYYHSIDTAKLPSLLKSTQQFQYKIWTVFFDLTGINDQPHFDSVLTSLATFYRHCSQCAPLLAVFNLPTSKLSHWSTNIITLLNKDARLVLVSTRMSTTKPIVVHLNPVLFGCKAIHGVWVPRSVQQFDQMRQSSDQCDLKGAVLNVSFNNALPYCNIKQQADGRTVINFAFETEILKELQLKYHFSSALQDAHGTWGMLVNSSWNGVVGRVLNGTSHMAICAVSRTLARSQVVAYSSSVYIDELTFMSKRPARRNRNWLVLQPFSWQLWTGILLSLAVLSGILWTSIQLSWERSVRAPSAIDISIELFAIYMGKTTALSSSILPARLLYAVWILGALILSNSYGGCFYSILAVPEYEPPIDTIADIARIARTDSGYLITLGESAYLQMFLSAPPNGGNIFHQIGQHMNRTKQYMMVKGEEAIRAIEGRPRTSLICTKIYLMINRHLYAKKRLHIGKEMLSLDSMHFIFPKKSPLVEPFSLIIRRLYQNGVVEKLLQSTFDRLPWKPGGSLNRNPVTKLTRYHSVLALKDLRSVYLLYAMGISLSIGSFLYENLIHLFCRQVIRIQAKA